MMQLVNALGVHLTSTLSKFVLFPFLLSATLLSHTYQKQKKKHCCLICGHLGARFGFVLDEELKKAASCDEVKDALAAKISRERIGVEVCICILK